MADVEQIVDLLHRGGLSDAESTKVTSLIGGLQDTVRGLAALVARSLTRDELLLLRMQDGSHTPECIQFGREDWSLKAAGRLQDRGMVEQFSGDATPLSNGPLGGSALLVLNNLGLAVRQHLQEQRP